MWVGTFSGVTSPGIVISSARGGTKSGNSSPTRARMMDVLPHWATRQREKKSWVTKGETGREDLGETGREDLGETGREDLLQQGERDGRSEQQRGEWDERSGLQGGDREGRSASRGRQGWEI